MDKNKQIIDMTFDIMNEACLPLELSGAIATGLYNKGYCKSSDVVKEIFEKLYANIKFDGNTVSVWKNDLIEAAKEYGITLE